MIKQNPELKSKILEEDEKTKLMSLSGVKKYLIYNEFKRAISRNYIRTR